MSAPSIEGHPGDHCGRTAPLIAVTGGMERSRAEAVVEGFRFPDRLVDDWRSGPNRSDRAGEVLLGAYRSADLVAVGGVSREPNVPRNGVGRLRHPYEAVGASLRGGLRARVGVDRPRPRVLPPPAAQDRGAGAAEFYVGFGFLAVGDLTATHVLNLPDGLDRGAAARVRTVETTESERT